MSNLISNKETSIVNINKYHFLFNFRSFYWAIPTDVNSVQTISYTGMKRFFYAYNHPYTVNVKYKQTWSSCILLTIRCSSITLLSNSSWSSFEWNRMKTLYCWYISLSSGERFLSNGSGNSKFLSSMKSFLRFLSSSLSCQKSKCIIVMDKENSIEYHINIEKKVKVALLCYCILVKLP